MQTIKVINKKPKINHFNNIGKIFGKLTVLEVIKYSKYYKYKCKCKCGTKSEHYAQAILNGITKSCGCLYKASRHLKKIVYRKDIKYGLNCSAANAVWLYYKRNAISRGLKFSINKIWFLKNIIKSCHYCGTKPLNLKKINNKKSPSFKYNGLDRLNNLKGYTYKNCVPCCPICNRAKGQLSYKHFLKWIKNIKRTKL